MCVVCDGGGITECGVALTLAPSLLSSADQFLLPIQPSQEHPCCECVCGGGGWVGGWVGECVFVNE